MRTTIVHTSTSTPPVSFRRPLRRERRAHGGLTRFVAPLALAGGLALVSFPAPAGADVVEITTAKDNTLIQDNYVYLSLGAGPYMFAGRVGPNGEGLRRRALMHFDIDAAVPAGSTIESVTLRLWMAGTSSGNQTVSLRRLTSDWGEGPSFAYGGLGAPATPGDATWAHTYYPNEMWGSLGGDFVDTVSASRTVGGVNYYTWGSTPEMVADVQAWLDGTVPNFGWVLMGNESALKTVKKFSTREDTASLRPLLTITFTPPAMGNPADLNHDGAVDGADLGILLGAWGTAGPGDLDGNGSVDGADLGMLLAAWSPAAG